MSEEVNTVILHDGRYVELRTPQMEHFAEFVLYNRFSVRMNAFYQAADQAELGLTVPLPQIDLQTLFMRLVAPLVLKISDLTVEYLEGLDMIDKLKIFNGIPDAARAPKVRPTVSNDSAI